MSTVEAIIVAGGLGSRLRPLTQHRPKHLLPVADVPFVVHQLAKLAAAGVDRVVLATSYQADQFKPVLGDGRTWGLDLVYVTERDPLGTAGAIRNAADHLRATRDEPVVILNGDILSGHDLGAQLAAHRRHAADVTLHLVDVEDARPYGCVPTDQTGRVLEFVEKSPDPVSDQVNAGCYVFTRSVIHEIPPHSVASVERDTFPALLARGGVVRGHVDGSYWLDLGTPEALVRASADLVRGVAVSPAYDHPPAQARIAPEATVADGAVARGGTAVAAAARLDSGAVVEGSVICAGARLGRNSLVVASVVGPGAQVGADVVLRGAVIGDRAVVGDRCELLTGVRVGCDITLPAAAVRFSPDL